MEDPGEEHRWRPRYLCPMLGMGAPCSRYGTGIGWQPGMPGTPCTLESSIFLPRIPGENVIEFSTEFSTDCLGYFCKANAHINAHFSKGNLTGGLGKQCCATHFGVVGSLAKSWGETVERYAQSNRLIRQPG